VNRNSVDFAMKLVVVIGFSGRRLPWSRTYWFLRFRQKGVVGKRVMKVAWQEIRRQCQARDKVLLRVVSMNIRWLISDFHGNSQTC